MPYFPDSIMPPNVKDQSADIKGVSDVVSASDFNKHDEEIIAIEKVVGVKRPMVPPIGFSCQGATPGCSGYAGCTPVSYGLSNALQAALASLNSLRDSCRICSGVIASGSRIPFPSDWHKTSLAQEIPAVPVVGGVPDYSPITVALNSVNQMPNEGYITIINDMSTETTQAELNSADFVWASKTDVPQGWSVGSSMLESRTSAGVVDAIILLGNSQVFVYGGGITTTSHNALPSEIYDISAGVWSATGASVNRGNARIALMQDGRVLASGGSISGSVLSSAEIYSPSGSWSTTASMTTARQHHTASTLANGRVLICGGFNSSSVVGNEIYDPVSSSWSPAAGMIEPRYLHQALRLSDGRVFVYGGYTALGEAVAAAHAEVYTPTTDSWAQAPLPGASAGRCVLFDPLSNTYSITGPVVTVRDSSIQLSLVQLSSGKVLITGGSATILSSGKVLVSGGNTNLCEIYDPVLNVWAATGSLSIVRTAPTVLIPDGRVLILGGGSNGKSTEFFGDAPENLTKFQSGVIVSSAPNANIADQVAISVSDRDSSNADVYGKLLKATVGSTIKLTSGDGLRYGVYSVTTTMPSASDSDAGGFILGLNYKSGSSASFARKEAIHFAIVNDLIGAPVMSSMRSSENPVFRINNTSAPSALTNTPLSIFGIGTNVEVLFYSGLDCDNALLLNVYRACNGTTATRHGPGDLVFKGIASISASPIMFSGTPGTNFDGMECFLRSNGTVSLRTFNLSSGAFVDDTLSAFVSYQGTLIKAIPSIRPFDQNSVEDDCIDNPAPPPVGCNSAGSGVAPVITSALSAGAFVGLPFSYTITATGDPDSFGASGLPSGLVVDGDSGIISGTVLSVVTTSITITATNDFGTDTKTLTLTSSTPPPPPPPVVSPSSFTGVVGTPLTGQIVASNFPTSYGITGVPPGLTMDPTTGVITGTPTLYGQFTETVSATNAGGSGTGTVTWSIAPFNNHVLLYSFDVDSDPVRSLSDGISYGDYDPSFMFVGAGFIRPTFIQFYQIGSDPDAHDNPGFIAPTYFSAPSPQGSPWSSPVQATYRFRYGDISKQNVPGYSGDPTHAPWVTNELVGAIAKFTLTNNGTGSYPTVQCAQDFLIIANTDYSMDLVPLPYFGYAPAPVSPIPAKILGARAPRLSSGGFAMTPKVYAIGGLSDARQDGAAITNWHVSIWSPYWGTLYPSA